MLPIAIYDDVRRNCRICLIQVSNPTQEGADVRAGLRHTSRFNVTVIVSVAISLIIVLLFLPSRISSRSILCIYVLVLCLHTNKDIYISGKCTHVLHMCE